MFPLLGFLSLVLTRIAVSLQSWYFRLERGPGIALQAMQDEMPEMWVPSLGREDSPGEGNGNPLQYSCLENSIDRGAWWATVHGVTKSRTQLSVHVLAIINSAVMNIGVHMSLSLLVSSVCMPSSAQKSPDTPGSPEGNTEGPGTASSEPLLPS